MMRALGMMQALAGAYARGETPWGPDREIVTRETAVNAVMDLFATLDASLQTGEPIPEERLLHAMSMLMLVREYVLPLRATAIFLGRTCVHHVFDPRLLRRPRVLVATVWTPMGEIDSVEGNSTKCDPGWHRLA
jgi:hypothetical protein